MLRKGDVLFGVLLLLLTMSGLATAAAPWFIVLSFTVGCSALYVAAYGRDRVGGSVGTMALAAIMAAGSIVSLVRYSSELWLYWLTLAIAVASFVVAVVSARSSSDSKVPPRIVRMGHDRNGPTR